MGRVKSCPWPDKKAHATKAEAIAHLLWLEKQYGDKGLKIYRCPTEKHWHVGHRLPRELRNSLRVGAAKSRRNRRVRRRR